MWCFDWRKGLIPGAWLGGIVILVGGWETKGFFFLHCRVVGLGEVL